MKTSFIILFAAFIYSCNSSSHSNQQSAISDTINTLLQKIDSSKNTPSSDTLQDVLNVEPYLISTDIFKQKDISLGNTFNRDSALTALFPGHYCKLHRPFSDNKKDSLALEIWSYHLDNKKALGGYYLEDTINFPLSDSNQTEYDDTLQFVDDSGRKNIIISFASIEYTTDLMKTGRFDGAILGLAQFQLENKQWHLKTFVPALAYCGSFQSIPQIKLIKLGKNNYGCYIEDCNGPAGGPYYCSKYIFGIVNGEFKTIFSESGLERSYGGMSDWKSEFSFDNNDKEFNDLKIITKGNYRDEDFDIYDTSNIPDAIKAIAKTRKKFSYTILSHYTFENGAYQFKIDEVSTGKLRK